LGVTDSSVISALVATLQDQSDWVRGNAARSLGHLGVTDESVISVLVAALQDENNWVQMEATRSLSQLKIKDETQLQRVLIALNQSLYYDNDIVFEKKDVLDAIRKLLNGRQIPGYRWHSFEKRQQKWQSLKNLQFKKIILIFLVSLLVLILGADFT